MKYTVSEYVTRRGSRGLILNVAEAPVVSMSFNFRAGYRYVADFQHKAQVAHVLEHMIAGSNTAYPDPAKYEQVFTKNGAYGNAFTGVVYMTHVAQCADFEWQRIMALMRYQLTAPNYDNKIFAVEKENVRSELTGYLSQAGRMIGPQLAREMGFADLTYPEALKTLDNMTLDDLKAHYARTYTAENMRFVVAGDFADKETELKAALEAIDLPTGGERFALPIDSLHSASATLIHRDDVPGVTFLLCLEVTRELSDQECYNMDALNHILNGTMNSRIFGQARQRGILYGCGSGTDATNDHTEWWFSGRATNDNLPAVFELIRAELERVKRGEIDDEDLADAKSYSLGRFRMGIQTASQLSNYLSGRYYYDGTIRQYDNEPRYISAVNRDEITRLAREFFTDGIWGVGLYGTTDQAMADRLKEEVGQLFCV